MAIVRFHRFGEIEVPVGETILAAAERIGAPEGSACGGACACSTCHVYVTSGVDLLSPQDEDEADMLDRAFDVRPGSRLGCQARIIGECVIEVDISEESLQTYENEHPRDRGKYVLRRTLGRST